MYGFSSSSAASQRGIGVATISRRTYHAVPRENKGAQPPFRPSSPGAVHGRPNARCMTTSAQPGRHRTSVPAPSATDFLGIDALLERRRTADPRHGARVRARPRAAEHRAVVRRPHVPESDGERARRSRPARDAPARLRLRRHQRGRVRPRVSRARSGRLRLPLVRLRARVARDVRDLGRTARRSRRRRGCRAWRRAMRSDASA